MDLVLNEKRKPGERGTTNTRTMKRKPEVKEWWVNLNRGSMKSTAANSWNNAFRYDEE